MKELLHTSMVLSLLTLITSCGVGGGMSFETVEDASKNLNGTVWADKNVLNKIEFANGAMIGYEATTNGEWKRVWFYRYRLEQYHYVDNQKPFVHIESIEKGYTDLPALQFHIGNSPSGHWALVIPLPSDNDDYMYLWQTSTRDVRVGDKSVLLIHQ